MDDNDTIKMFNMIYSYSYKSIWDGTTSRQVAQINDEYINLDSVINELSLKKDFAIIEIKEFNRLHFNHN